jgi:ubiquitin carboxyl-terminal hydrolase 7
MNSFLQALFHLPAFRRLVYSFPTKRTEDAATNIPLNLQRLFGKMQLRTTDWISTNALRRSFGGGDAETFLQHDVEEFCRVLLDNIEQKLKATPFENAIAGLFRGRYRSFIRCKNVVYENSRIEQFYDLQLAVRETGDLRRAFEKYIEPEELTGANQYKTDDFSLQDAEMGLNSLNSRRFYNCISKGLITISPLDSRSKSINASNFLQRSISPSFWRGMHRHRELFFS